MKKSCIIAEIGTSHGGDLGKAIEMIHAAKESGADTAKFQWVYADEIIHPKTGTVNLPTGSIPLYDRFRSLEKGPDFFGKLKEACDALEIEFLCTPFGLQSAMELWDLGVTRFKIASPELNHLPLIEFLAATGADLIISSGVSRLSDIEEALDTVTISRVGQWPHLWAASPTVHDFLSRRFISSQIASPSTTLLHCMTAYPAPEDEYNLLLVRNLSHIFGVATGISDHSLDPLLVPVVSTILGGTVIEKHFTLSNDTDGLDDPIALNPQNFSAMVQSVRLVEDLLVKNSNLQHSDPCGQVMESLIEAQIPHDPNQVCRILGNGIKNLAPTEATNYGRTNRSIHALGDLKPGTMLNSENTTLIRSEKILRPGLHPRYQKLIIGKKITKEVPDGEGIRWQDLIE